MTTETRIQVISALVDDIMSSAMAIRSAVILNQYPTDDTILKELTALANETFELMTRTKMRVNERSEEEVRQ